MGVGGDEEDVGSWYEGGDFAVEGLGDGEGLEGDDGERAVLGGEDEDVGGEGLAAGIGFSRLAGGVSAEGEEFGGGYGMGLEADALNGWRGEGEGRGEEGEHGVLW